MKSILKYRVLIFLLLSAVLLRFYKLAQVFFFNIDEEWYSYIVRKITVFHHPVLIGWEIPGGLLVPPVMYYYGALVMLVSGNNPLGLAVNASIFGVFGVFLIYFVGKIIFQSKSIALYSSLVYCFSFVVVIYNRLSINLLFAPLLALLTYLSLYLIVKSENKIKGLLILSLVFPFATQEGSMISLIILSIFILVIYKVSLKSKYYLLLFIPLFISLLPVIIFNFLHDFLVVNKLLSFFQFSPSSLSIHSIFSPFLLLFRTISRMLFPTGPSDINVQILPCQRYIDTINQQTPAIYILLGFLFILFFIYKSIVKKSSFGQQIILYHLSVISLGLIAYSVIKPGYLHEWFFVILMPAYAFIIAFFLNYAIQYKVGRYLMYVFILSFLAINISYTFSLNATMGYSRKLWVVKKIIDTVGTYDFELSMLGDGCNGYGYRYLFTYQNHEPVESYTDKQYVNWLYSASEKKESAYQVIIVLFPDLTTNKLKEQYKSFKEKASSSVKDGNVETLFIRK